MSMRRQLNEKLQERTDLLEQAEGLLKEGKREDYRTAMDKVRNMNAEIDDMKSLIAEQDRKLLEKAPNPAEERDKAAERGNLLMKGQEVKFTAEEVGKALFLPSQSVEKSVTLATGTLAQPTGAGTNIRVPAAQRAMSRQNMSQHMTRLRPAHRSPFLPSISHSIRPSTFRLLLPALLHGRAVMLPLQRQKPVFPVSSSFTALRRARPRSPQRAQMALHLPPFPSRSPRRKLSALRTQHRILSQPVHPSI